MNQKIEATQLARDLLLSVGKGGIVLVVLFFCGCLPEATTLETGQSVDDDLADVESTLVMRNDLRGMGSKTRFEIDGEFNEWEPSYVIANDPAGDANGAFDITELMAAICGDHLFVSFSLNGGSKATLQNGVESDGTLQLIFREGKKKLTLNVRDRTFHINNRVLAWRDFDFRCLPTFASPRYELRVKLQGWDMTNVKVDFAGSDHLNKPVQVTAMVDPEQQSTAFDISKTEGAFRLANLNTLENGLANPSRSSALFRLLAASEADIYTFQEEWNASKFEKVIPGLSDMLGIELRSHWFGGCAILSRLPLVPLPMTLDRAAAGLIQIDEGEYVAVISVHLKSAGYAGSREDSLRIQQAEQLVREITKMRNGDFGKDAQGAAVIVVGDYNLVGSRLPLDVLFGAGLKDVVFKDAKTGDAMTWQGEERTNFWPGRLDWLCHGEKLKVSKRLILNSGTLNESELEEIKVQKSDSLSSDHLMLIGDFQIQ